MSDEKDTGGMRVRTDLFWQNKREGEGFVRDKVKGRQYGRVDNVGMMKPGGVRESLAGGGVKGEWVKGRNRLKTGRERGGVRGESQALHSFRVRPVVMVTAARRDEQQTDRLALSRSQSLSMSLAQRLVDS